MCKTPPSRPHTTNKCNLWNKQANVVVHTLVTVMVGESEFKASLINRTSSRLAGVFVSKTKQHNTIMELVREGYIIIRVKLWMSTLYLSTVAINFLWEYLPNNLKRYTITFKNILFGWLCCMIYNQIYLWMHWCAAHVLYSGERKKYLIYALCFQRLQAPFSIPASCWLNHLNNR